MPLKSAFATLIHYEDLLEKGGDKLNKELLKEAYQIREFDEEGREWSEDNYVGGYTSYASMANLHEFSSTFMELEEAINQHAAAYADELDLDIEPEQLKMTDCWLNIMPAGVGHSFHLHPLSLISGTYYVSTPKGSSDIRFEDPRLACFMNRPTLRPDYRKRSRQYLNVKAKAGKLVLFESWLKHEVPASRNDEDRISISFNYNWFGELGVYAREEEEDFEEFGAEEG